MTKRILSSLALLLPAAALLPPASQAPAGLRFAVSFPAARSAAPLDGRLLILISTDTAADQQAIRGTLDGWNQALTAGNDSLLASFYTEDAECDRALETIEDGATKSALRTVAVLPLVMLACYVGLILWFRARGGYRAIELTAPPPGS